MNVYFAAAENSNYKLVSEASHKANMLMSYYSLRTKTDSLETIKQDGRKYFLDSGAFTAYTKGVHIDIQEFIQFIKDTQSIWTVVAGLDVIKDWEGSARNQKILDDAGVKTMPTFHIGSPLEELHRLCQNYDYIALGGLVAFASNRQLLRDWLSACFVVIRDYWPKKIHGFGINSFNLWKQFPFYSVDSTSWLAMCNKLAYAGIFYKGKMKYYPGFGKNGRLSREHTIMKAENPYLVLKYKDDGTTRNYIDRAKRIIQELIIAGEYVTDIWVKRGIKWE